ncbi:MAG: hypothetical protein ACR2FS_17915, partial [Phormidesmis sp.]
MDTTKKDGGCLDTGILSKKILRLYPEPAQSYRLFAGLVDHLDDYLKGDPTVEVIEICFGGKTTALDVAFLRALQG